MSHSMADFNVGGKRYELLHLNSDDSRVVIGYDDPTTVLLRFDSSLNVLRNGETVGRIGSANDEFSLERDGKSDPLGVKVNDWHWNNIVKAEVAIATLLLGEVR